VKVFKRADAMMRLMKRVATCCALSMLMMGAAREARAQGGIYLSPFITTTLSSPSNVGSRTKPGFGAALGNLGSFIGGEAEIVYFPELLDNSAQGLSQNKVITFGANTVIGPRIGPVKVYGAFGGGAMYLNVKSVSSIVVPNPESVSSTKFALNAGGGAVFYVSGHFGLRGDLRWYRAIGFKMSDIEATGPTLDQFDFWRAGFGIVIY